MVSKCFGSNCKLEPAKGFHYNRHSILFVIIPAKEAVSQYLYYVISTAGRNLRILYLNHSTLDLFDSPTYLFSLCAIF